MSDKIAFYLQGFKGEKGWALYLTTIVLVVIAHFLGAILLIGVGYAQLSAGRISQSDLNSFFQTSEMSLLGIPSYLTLIILLSSFVFSMVALWICVKKIHKRVFITVINAFEKVRWGRVLFGFIVWLVFTIVIEVFNYFMHPEYYTLQFELSKFIPLLLVCIFILPIQTSFEEILLRGYALQGMALWAKKIWIPIVLTSFIFAFLHIANPEIAEFGMGIMMAYYFLVAAFLAIITIMDEGLELALGIHWATNLFGATAVTFKGSALQTDAIFKTSTVDAPLMLAFFILSAIIFIVIAKNKYGWSSLNKVFGDIIPPIQLKSETASV